MKRVSCEVAGLFESHQHNKQGGRCAPNMCIRYCRTNMCKPTFTLLLNVAYWFSEIHFPFSDTCITVCFIVICHSLSCQSSTWSAPVASLPAVLFFFCIPGFMAWVESGWPSCSCDLLSCINALYIPNRHDVKVIILYYCLFPLVFYRHEMKISTYVETKFYRLN